MSDNGRIPKLEDVALIAGVSSATVSRFFNNPGMVATATADRIREAVATTHYVPNLMAGGLASSRSRLVALLVPDVAQSIFNATVEAMVDELSASGDIVMLGLTGVDNARMQPLISAALSSGGPTRSSSPASSAIPPRANSCAGARLR